MKHNFSYLLIAIVAMLTACTAEENVSGGNNNEEKPKGIYGSAESKVVVNEDLDSRSVFYYTTNALKFAWKAGDKLSVFPDESSSKLIYTLKDSGIGKSNASFSGEGFTLKKGKTYYAFSKEIDGSPTSINVTYAGQRQESNYTLPTSGEMPLENLGDYDFMMATSVCEEEDAAFFEFQHIGYTLGLVLENVPTDQRFKAIEIYDSGNKYRQPNRTIDLTDGTSDWKTVDMTTTENQKAPRFTLNLGLAPGDPDYEEDYIGISPTSDGKITAFIELPSFDFTNSSLIVSLINSNPDDKNYYAEYSPMKKYVGGTTYMKRLQVKEATSFKVNLKINHTWQHGNVAEKSRATGDPGVEDKFELPTHLYYVYCVGGNVRQIGQNFYTELSDIQDNWTPTADKGISTYKDDFVFTIDKNADTDKTKHVYFVAATKDLSACFSKINASTTEEEIKKLVYSISGSQEETQAFMRDLYSTPWDAGSFVGDLKDPVQDVYLYHVAAKVDIKWNSKNALDGNVSVNNVQNNNLLLFQPTQNGAITFTEPTTNTYSVNTAFDTGNKWNGRQVYYLPQTADGKYNIGIGSNAFNNFDFNSQTNISTEGGFTSWLRSQITIE